MSGDLTPYFPRLLIEWAEDAPDATWREVDGSLVFMDISGFTAMSERLARKGKVGAEEVTEVMSSTFARLLEAAYAQGAYLLKFGGDAMFLLFTGPEHPARACRAAVEMRGALRGMGRFETSAGAVALRMSVGVHSGRVTFVLAGDSHRELLVIGDAVSATARMETAASATQIVVSQQTAAALPAACVGEMVGDGRLLKRAPPTTVSVPAPMTIDKFAEAERFIPMAIRSQLAAGVHESEHRAVTVAFVHFDGTDAVVDHAGPGAAAAMLDTLVRRVQAAAEAYDVCFLATDVDVDGGKIILTAGAPTSGDNDEERMLRAVRAIADDPGPLPVRIGVHRGAIFAGNVGPFYRRTYTVMGDAVNLAARLMGKAHSGEILTTADVLDRSRTLFETTELPPLTLKGKARPVTAYSVGAIAGTRGRRQGDVLPFVGRARDLEMLIDGLRSTERTGGRLIEISGDSGVGKSRLISELKLRCADVPSFEATCEQYESSTAYFAFAQLLRAALGLPAATDKRETQAALVRARVERDAADLLPWLPLIGTVIDVEFEPTPESRELQPAFRQGRLHFAVARLLSRVVPGQALFVIEDAHWIDDASRALLAYVLANTGDAGWLWCASRRIGASAVSLDDLPAATSLVLEPLDPAASARLAAAAAGDVPLPQHEFAALTERAGGNPLFLQELVAARIHGGAGALPESVEALVVSRIDALSPSGRRALRYAAVLGGAFRADWLEGSFTGLLDDDVARMIRQLDEFIVADGDAAYRFRHALVREVAYEALPFRLRRTLHERAGEYFERAAGDSAEAQAELLSLHFSLAHDDAKAYRYSRIAGERSKAKWANVEAAEFFRRAIASARQAHVDAQEVASLSESLGDVSELAGLFVDAIDAYGNARRLAPAGDNVRRLLLKEGVMRERVGRYAPAIRWYGRALRACGIEDVADRVKISLAYAGVRFRQGRYAECADWCRRALPEAEACGDRASLAHAYYLLAHACTFLGSDEGSGFRALALGVYEELGDFVGQANVLNNLGVAAYYYEGAWEEALDFYRRSRVARERAGDVVGAATAANNIAEILSDQGQLDEAHALLLSALAVWRGARYPVGVAVATSNLGLVAARSGDLAEARRLLEQALAGFREIKADSFIFETESRLAEVAVLSGEDARDAIDGLIARAEHIDGVARVIPQLYRLLAELALRAGDPADARRMIDESIARARASGATYELMLALSVAVRAGLASVDETAAFESESREIARRLGIVRADAGIERGVASVS